MPHSSTASPSEYSVSKHFLVSKVPLKEEMEAPAGDPTVKLLGMAFMAPVAGYVLIGPADPNSKGPGQILRAISTVLVSAAILAVTTGNDWHVAHSRIRVQYSAYHSRKVDGAISVKIGLGSTNVILQGSVPDLPHSQVEYDEKFIWSHADDMKRHYSDALVRGLPYPILTAVEYLSLDAEGFRWGRSYRQAGYYAYFVLWMAFALWLLTNILWSLDVVFGSITLTITGALLLLTNLIYTGNLAKRPLVIPYDSQRLEFDYGWCYYATMLVGSLCMLFGIIIYLTKFLQTNHFNQIPVVPEKYPQQQKEDLYSKGWRRQVSCYQQFCDTPTPQMCWSQ